MIIDVKFVTPVYHPNIDQNGRICLDKLKKQGWNPTMSLEAVLTSIRLLLQQPNPDDPLMADIVRALYLAALLIFMGRRRSTGSRGWCIIRRHAITA